jgi:hypothetical protein
MAGHYGTNSVNVEFQHGVAVAIALVAVEVACDVRQSHSNTLLKHLLHSAVINCALTQRFRLVCVCVFGKNEYKISIC